MKMTIREVLEKLASDGWNQVKQEGSHRQFKHAVKPGKVTVAGHPKDMLHPKTLNSIFRQAGWMK